MDLFDMDYWNTTESSQAPPAYTGDMFLLPPPDESLPPLNSPYMRSPTKRRYSIGGCDGTRWTPYVPFMSPIVTTTRSHAIKRNRRPSTYSRWTLDEDELLRQAVQVHGPHKWSLIASHVPNRTPMQCSTRYLGTLNSPHIHKGRWTENEDTILRYSVLEYAHRTDPEGRSQPIPWNKIAERIPNRTGIQCQARWTEALDPYVRKGKWAMEEDELLKMGVLEFGRCWIRIAETIPGRTQRQCRTRWMQMKYKEDQHKLKSVSHLSTDEEYFREEYFVTDWSYDTSFIDNKNIYL